MSVHSTSYLKQEIGYRGEIGYQTFLYSNEADIRKVFMFLVEKLPKESSESSTEPLGICTFHLSLLVKAEMVSKSET